MSCNTGAALLGLGYIVGLKYAFVIFAGSAFVWWIIIPLMGTYGSADISSMAPAAIFSNYARLIGIGGIAMAGIIGIIKSWGIIMQAAGLAAREMKGKTGDTKSTVRRQLDISMKHVVFFMTIALVAVFIFFWAGVLHNFWQALVAWSGCNADFISVHHSCRQRHCNRGLQPGERHDFDDPYHSIGHICGHRHQRHLRYCRLDGDRRCCVHSAVNGRRLCYRP